MKTGINALWRSC